MSALFCIKMKSDELQIFQFSLVVSLVDCVGNNIESLLGHAIGVPVCHHCFFFVLSNQIAVGWRVIVRVSWQILEAISFPIKCYLLML